MQYDPNESIGSAGSGIGGGSATNTGAETAGAVGGTVAATTGASEERLGQAKEKASHFKASLADKLEQGAHKLRERASAHREGNGPGALGVSGEIGEGSASYSKRAERKLDRASESLAHGMENTANWVRNADLEKMKGDVETQVRANPGRSLLVAVGVGYLLGKILRGGSRRT